MKKLTTLFVLLVACQMLAGQNWEGFRFTDTISNGEIQTFDPNDPWWSITYIDSSYWGTILTYPEYKELPHPTFPTEKPFEYNFDPFVPEKRWKFSEPAKVILLFGSAVILEAIGDGLYDDGQKELGKLFQASSVGLLVASPFILNVDKSKWFWYFLSYTSMRMALFDPAYNLTRGLNMGYTGNTSYWDRGIQMFDPPQGMKIWGHSVVFIIAITIPINNF